MQRPPGLADSWEISYEVVQRRRDDLAFRGINHSLDLNVSCSHLDSVDIEKTFVKLFTQIEVIFSILSQTVMSLLIHFMLNRTVWLWIYCYNPLYHKGELKGKGLNAGLSEDQQTGTERDPVASASVGEVHLSL